MKPYFEDELVTLYHGDCREVMASFDAGSVDCVITDPPYTERTHSKARANTSDGVREGISFGSFSDEDLRAALRECGRVSKGWVIATLDYNHAFQFETEPPEGLRQLRIGVWVKRNPMPQLTGDRPAQGWEAISYMHKPGKARWNGGGNHGNYVMPIATPNGHPTPKPVALLSSVVSRFTDEGDLILDPFAGGGQRLWLLGILAGKLSALSLRNGIARSSRSVCLSRYSIWEACNAVA